VSLQGLSIPPFLGVQKEKLAYLPAQIIDGLCGGFYKRWATPCKLNLGNLSMSLLFNPKLSLHEALPPM